MSLQRLLTITLVSLVAFCASETIYGVTTVNRLAYFNTTAPASPIVGPLITGISPDYTIRSIDFRPVNGLLYAIATNNTSGSTNASSLVELYTISLTNGVATLIGSAFSIPSNSSSVHIDFNPVVDRIRLVTGDGLNYRINPDNANIAGNDTRLNSSSSQSISVANIAYTNNFAGATNTTLYAFESISNNLDTIGSVGGTISPNGGQLFNVGPTGQTISLPSGLDVSTATGIAYASDSTGNVYTVNLSSGAYTLLGQTGTAFIDIAVPIVNNSTTTGSATTGAAATTGALATTGNFSVTSTTGSSNNGTSTTGSASSTTESATTGAAATTGNFSVTSTTGSNNNGTSTTGAALSTTGSSTTGALATTGSNNNSTSTTGVPSTTGPTGVATTSRATTSRATTSRPSNTTAVILTTNSASQNIFFTLLVVIAALCAF